MTRRTDAIFTSTPAGERRAGVSQRNPARSSSLLLLPGSSHLSKLWHDGGLVLVKLDPAPLRVQSLSRHARFFVWPHAALAAVSADVFLSARRPHVAHGKLCSTNA